MTNTDPASPLAQARLLQAALAFRLHLARIGRYRYPSADAWIADVRRLAQVTRWLDEYDEGSDIDKSDQVL